MKKGLQDSGKISWEKETPAGFLHHSSAIAGSKYPHPTLQPAEVSQASRSASSSSPGAAAPAQTGGRSLKHRPEPLSCSSVLWAWQPQSQSWVAASVRSGRREGLEISRLERHLDER